MNVLHINEQRGWRGGEQQASYLIRGLAQRGHSVFIAGRPGTPFLEADHGVENLVRVAAPFRSEWDFWTAWRLARAVKELRIDVLHAHTSHAHTAACFARMLAGRGKVVVSRRVDFPPRKGPFTRWKYALPDRIVAVSSFIAGVLRAYGIPEERLRVVRSATNPARFDVPPLPRSELGVPEGVPLLGSVGALVGHKDHANLMDAMSQVLRAVPDLHLVVAGDGVWRPEIEAQIARLGIATNVHLLGHRQDVPRILRTLDAFVISSKEEGFGGAALEAMACGLPVAATAAGGIPESVLDDQTGLVVPVRDPEALAAAIVRIFSEPALAERLSEAARAFVLEQGTIEFMIEGNLRVYEELVGPK